jgi:hypothetical protein
VAWDVDLTAHTSPGEQWVELDKYGRPAATDARTHQSASHAPHAGPALLSVANTPSVGHGVSPGRG